MLSFLPTLSVYIFTHVKTPPLRGTKFLFNISSFFLKLFSYIFCLANNHASNMRSVIFNTGHLNLFFTLCLRENKYFWIIADKIKQIWNHRAILFCVRTKTIIFYTKRNLIIWNIYRLITIKGLYLIVSI